MIVTYMLELTKEELSRLEVLLRLLDTSTMTVGRLDPTEKAILEKVQRLMEGR